MDKNKQGGVIMDDFFMVLLLLSIVCLIIGIKNPNKMVFWSKNKTKKQAILGYSLMLIIFFFLFGATSPKQTDSITTSKPEPNSKATSTLQTAQPTVTPTLVPTATPEPTPVPTLSPAEIAKKAEEEKINAAAKKVADHKKWVDDLFSPWDGSCRDLVQLVKDNMNDPDSFKHVETRYSNNEDDSVTIIMKYRGKNGFGGVVTEYVEAKVDYTTNIISIVSQE